MRFIWILAVLCGLAISSSGLDREAFTVSKYDLEITLDPGQQRLGARGKITLRNDSSQAQKIAALQISSSLNWRSIRADGKALQFVSQPFTSDIDHTGGLSEAVVTLPAEIKPKDSLDLEVGYEGIIPLDATRLVRVGVPAALAKHTSWDQISPSFTAVRGAGYVAWYPITTESADFSEGNSLFEVVDRWKARAAHSEFKAKIIAGADSHDSVICSSGAPHSGERSSGSSSERSSDRSTAECSWKQLGAVTPTFAMASYQDLSKPPFYLYALPGHETGAGIYTNALEPAKKFVTEWFGPPTAPVTVADFADANSAPFESGTLLMASLAAEDTKMTGINLVHELVHAAMPSPRPWVYEGLAHFAEALYRQQQGGRQAALDFLGLHRATFLDSEKDVSAALQKNAGDKNTGQPLVTTFDETYYRSKSAYVWWMLYDLVGDDALMQAIRKYHPEYDTDPKYVEKLIEDASNRDLSWFFDDWVYRDRGLPDFRVQSVHPWKTEKGIQFLTVTLENAGDAGAEVPFTITFDAGEVRQKLEVRARSTATTRVHVPGVPTQLTINDGSVPELDLANNTFEIPAQ